MPFDGSPITSPDIQILEKMRSLLENGWTKGCFSRASDGTQVMYYDEHATQFCILGAYYRVTQELGINGFLPNLGFKKRSAVEAWNDHSCRKKEHVLKRIDENIDRLRAELLA